MTTLTTTLRPITRRPVRVFKDENTGREVRQLTDAEHGAHLGYFRNFKQIPGGLLLAWSKHEDGSAILIDPDTGAVDAVPFPVSALKVRESDGRVWYIRSAASGRMDITDKAQRRALARHDRQLWSIDLPHGEPVFIDEIPDDVPGDITDITIDGSKIILVRVEQDLSQFPIPTTKDLTAFWGYIQRPRRGEIWVYDLKTQIANRIYQTHGVAPSHIDTSPEDPTLIRFCHEMYDAYGQRVWTINTNGDGLRKIREQEYGELVTHEFWWADPKLIGLTYQDRRGESTLHDLPWAEYSPRPTHLALADLKGRQVYMSDPLNSYHTHLYVSPDGQKVCGEGTDGNSFVYAASFDIHRTRINMTRLATVHTPYIPFRGQGVDCNFSHDGKWLVYADKPGDSKVHQLFAVRADVD